MSRIIEVPQTGKLQGATHAPLGDFRIVGSDNGGFLSAVLSTTDPKLHHNSREVIYTVGQRSDSTYNRVMVPFYSAPTTSLMIQTLHGAFSGHQAVSLRPDTMWYMIVHEVTTHVKKHSKQYGELFGHRGGPKRVLHITDFNLHDHQDKKRWITTLQGFVRKNLLAAIVNDVGRLLLPHFSTTTPEDAISMVVALADMASPYYQIRIGSACHIPTIRLEGTPEDWRNIAERANELSRVFPRLQGYFQALVPVLQKIANSTAARKLDMEFWRSIYKYNSSSGTETITGWITAFLAHLHTPEGAHFRQHFGMAELGVNQFPSHVSTVPFVWESKGRERRMVLVGGITGVDLNEGKFLTPRLGYAVAEVELLKQILT